MDEVLMLRGLVGPCPDCRDERILLPVDDAGFELCCTDCDAAVVLLPSDAAQLGAVAALSA